MRRTERTSKIKTLKHFSSSRGEKHSNKSLLLLVCVGGERRKEWCEFKKMKRQEKYLLNSQDFSIIFYHSLIFYLVANSRCFTSNRLFSRPILSLSLSRVIRIVISPFLWKNLNKSEQRICLRMREKCATGITGIEWTRGIKRVSSSIYRGEGEENVINLRKRNHKENMYRINNVFQLVVVICWRYFTRLCIHLSLCQIESLHGTKFSLFSFTIGIIY